MVGLIVIWTIFETLNPVFLSPNNLVNMLFDCSTVGVISQAASFLASLIAVRRRQAHSRLDIFIYQAVGLAAAVAVYTIWGIVDPAGSVLLHKTASDTILWWGRTFDTRSFLLV